MVVTPALADATIVVTEVGESDAIDPVAGNLWSLQQGNYSVTVSAPGYLTWGPSLYSVLAETQRVAEVELTPMTDPTGVVAKVEIVALFDEEGQPYAQEKEIGSPLKAFLFAAQTEERVGVVVKVTDLQGDPIANAPVHVNLTEDYFNLIAIYPGLPTSMSPAGAPFSAGKTDADGLASFTIEATNAKSLMRMLHDQDISAQSQHVEALWDAPAKFIVSAVGQSNVNQRTEFKGFFVNMSHLHYADGYAAIAAGATDFSDVTLADTRLGHDFGLKVNVWKNEVGADNSHYFSTLIVRKQPTSTPVFAGGVESNGMVVYTMSGDQTDLVEWAGCDSFNPSRPLECINNGVPNEGVVALRPKGGVGLADLPITVEVHASFIYQVQYGLSKYNFELKDYTFTKTWVGGELEIDKYVTQHVLTWAGPDHTLKAFNFTNQEPYAGGLDHYLSTVVVNVSNSGGADFYNVTVRDQLPQELGVIKDTISDGGSYDEVNHVVTWDFNGTPSLQEIPIGESLTFTFEVYARQKPGFAWDATTAGVEPSSPDVPLLFAKGDYPDYYCVTNGQYFNSVTASGFYADDLMTSQPVFRYTPVVDESTICVVRPVFKLTKELLTQEVMIQGASAQYRLGISQVDRSLGSDIYAPLKALYPWEFGVDTLGSGHRGAGYEVRNNTYARDVFVEDRWEVGLDFTNATNFGGLGGGGVLNTSQAGIKRLSWSALTDLPIGVTRTATIALTGTLVSDSGIGNANGSAAANGAVQRLDGDGLYAWANCAYAYAGQLNQLNARGAIQPSIEPAYVTDLVTQGRWSRTGVDEVLEACALVAVTPPAGVSFVRLSTNGEAKSDSPTAIQDENVRVGDTFYYRFTVQNTGTADATNVIIRSDLVDSTVVGFSGTPLLYTSTNGTVWTLIPGSVVSIADQDEVTYLPRTVATGGWLRAVIPATAIQEGNTWVHAYVEFDDAGTQTSPIGPVTEETEVDQAF